MVQENELITMLLGFGILLFLIANRAHFIRVPSRRLLTISLLLFLTSWVSTVLEDFLWAVFLNLIEHISNLLGTLLLVVWIWRSESDSSEAL